MRAGRRSRCRSRRTSGSAGPQAPRRRRGARPGTRRREGARDRARKERGRGTESDLLTEPGGAPRRVGRVREEGGSRGARDDPTESNEHGREEDGRERVKDENPGDPDPGESAAEEDRGTPRTASREDRRWDRAGDDAEGLSTGEKTDREGIEAERSIEKVQVELGDAQAEAAEARRDQVEDGIASS